MIGLSILLVFHLAIALAAPLFRHARARLKPALAQSRREIRSGHRLGSSPLWAQTISDDRSGRERLVGGSRVSLFIRLAATVLTTAIGAVVGDRQWLSPGVASASALMRLTGLVSR